MVIFEQLEGKPFCCQVWVEILKENSSMAAELAKKVEKYVRGKTVASSFLVLCRLGVVYHDQKRAPFSRFTFCAFSFKAKLGLREACSTTTRRSICRSRRSSSSFRKWGETGAGKTSWIRPEVPLFVDRFFFSLFLLLFCALTQAFVGLNDSFLRSIVQYAVYYTGFLFLPTRSS